jgi:DNA polymerase III alpha subunit (gram-positive type)
MSIFSIDVEADGPCPGLYSMISFGAVRVDRELTTTFYGQLVPVSDKWIPEALAVSGFTREETEKFDHPVVVMTKFLEWLTASNDSDRPIMISDNPAFDWQFMNYYLHAYTGSNPMGHSARRIGDLYSGLRGKFNASSRDWHKLRKTKHTHHPVDDAKGNAEALIAMCDKWNLLIPGVSPIVQ